MDMVFWLINTFEREKKTPAMEKNKVMERFKVIERKQSVREKIK